MVRPQVAHGFVALALTGVLGSASQAVRYADDQARTILERSRASVSQGAPASALRSAQFTGRVRIPAENGSTSDGTVEISLRLPDRYLRVDRIDGRERRVLLSGQADDTSARTQFTTLVLGAFGIVVGGDAIVVRSTGETAFADTVAVDLNGRSLSARFVADAASLVPLRVVSFGSLSTSTVVSFANRRDAGGYQLPFRVTTQTSDRVLETLMFDDILVNPPLPDSVFRR